MYCFAVMRKPTSNHELDLSHDLVETFVSFSQNGNTVKLLHFSSLIIDNRGPMMVAHLHQILVDKQWWAMMSTTANGNLDPSPLFQLISSYYYNYRILELKIQQKDAGCWMVDAECWIKKINEPKVVNSRQLWSTSFSWVWSIDLTWNFK